MFKVNNKNNRAMPVLVSSLLTLNIFHTLLSFFILNFEHVIDTRKLILIAIQKQGYFPKRNKISKKVSIYISVFELAKN